MLSVTRAFSQSARRSCLLHTLGLLNLGFKRSMRFKKCVADLFLQFFED